MTTIIIVIIVIGVLTLIGDGNPFVGAMAVTVLLFGLGVALAAVAVVLLFGAWVVGAL